MVRPIKRIIADIETSPTIGMFWGCGYKVNISHDNILKERAIICIAWKVEGSSKVKSLTWDKNQSDRQLLIDFFNDIEDADEVIAHFGKGFDIPWLRTRVLFHGLNPMPLFKVVDTKEWASKNFYFQSNKLDYIAKFFGFGGKTHTEYQWWLDILLKNCPVALRKMVYYCRRDVTLLEKVFKKLLPHCQQEVHAGVMAGFAKWSCPRTGSRNVKLSKRRVTATGQVRYQFQNLDDGSYYSITQKDFNDYQDRNKPLQKVRGLAKARNSRR